MFLKCISKHQQSTLPWSWFKTQVKCSAGSETDNKLIVSPSPRIVPELVQDSQQQRPGLLCRSSSSGFWVWFPVPLFPPTTRQQRSSTCQHARHAGAPRLGSTGHAAGTAQSLDVGVVNPHGRCVSCGIECWGQCPGGRTQPAPALSRVS